MKQNRGRSWLWLLWLLPLWLNAESAYRWSATASKTHAVLHEAVLLEFVCRFDSEAYEYIIMFTPPAETATYRLVPESTAEHIVDGKRVNTYRFILFPKEAGRLELTFEAAMGHTTKASIENTVIGRDNVEKIDYTTRRAALPPVVLEVTDQPTPFAGRLALHVDVDKTQTEPFSPVQVRAAVEGYGNMDRLPPFTLDIPGVRIFGDDPEKRLTLGDEGYTGSVVQRFALVPEHGFTLPPLTLTYFDTEQNRTVTLASKAAEIGVKPSAPLRETKSDADGSPSAEEGGIAWLHIAIALVAGIVIGRFLLPVGVETEREETLPEKLKRCRDPEKFAAYLAILDADRYAKMIDELEKEIRLGKADLKKYKRRLGL